MEEPEELCVGDIYEDCSYHPCKCTEIDGDQVSGVSLIDGSAPRSCSLSHCGVNKLTQEEADKSIAAFKEGGRKGLLKLHGWSEEDIDKFDKEWGQESSP